MLSVQSRRSQSLHKLGRGRSGLCANVPGGGVIVLASRSPLDINESVQTILEIEGCQ